MAIEASDRVGRDMEVATIIDFLTSTERLPGAVVLSGEAGIGKTTLWLAGVDAADSSGYRTISARPSDAETRLSFAGLDDLLGSNAAELMTELPPVQRRALETALLLGDTDVPADERAVAAALLGAIRLLATDRPLCLAIDDVQWLDASSLAALRYALARLDGEPVATVLAVRGDVPDWLRRSIPRERLRTIELGGLSIGATRELLRTRLEVSFPRPTLIRLWETSGGNPFFALEMASALERRGGRVDPGEELPIPASLEELVQDRLERLSAAALEVARIVAALAEPTVRLLETAAGRRAQMGLADTLAGRILEVDGQHLRFTHPLLRSAVSSRVTPAERRSLHARLADVVPEAEERARHLAVATVEPSREIASLLDEAAVAVRSRGAPAAAAELAEQALRLTPVADAAASRRRILVAADHNFEAGDSGRAIALLDQARATAPPGVEHASILVHLARVQAEVVGLADATSLYHEAIAESEGDDRLQATIHLKLADLMRYTENAERGFAHAELAVRAASRSEDAALRCRALAAFGALHFNTGRGIPSAEMEQALALERSLPEWPLDDGATWIFSHQLVWSGDLEQARRLLDEWLDAVKARDDPEKASPLWYLSILEWRAGNWELAARYAAESLALREQVGRDTPPARWPNAIIAAHRGEVEAARGHAGRALAAAEATDNRVAQSGQRWVLGFLELSLGNPAAALEQLMVAEEIRDAFLLEPAMRPELPDTLEALIALGELDEAEARIETWEDRASRLDRTWALAILARAKGLLLAARGGDLEGSFASFERALAEHARSTDPFNHARTLLALGRTQRRAKRRAAARATLSEALERFERLAAPLWAEQARAELARIGGRAPSRDELTAAESRIAELVAQGKTNREVAAALFLTVRSVETALTRIYRKLGVRSRTELASREASKS
jgi:DNA-binding CsgD family transcriptional regulator